VVAEVRHPTSFVELSKLVVGAVIAFVLADRHPTSFVWMLAILLGLSLALFLVLAFLVLVFLGLVAVMVGVVVVVFLVLLDLVVVVLVVVVLVLAAWWKEEAMAACIENTLTLEEKGGVCRLQIHPKVLLNVRTLWHAFFVLKKTLSRLETAQFILPKSIDAFSLAELQQWLENFLNKLVVPYSIRDMYEKFL